MIRCYDCGQQIPDDEIVRRNVRTGISSGSGTSWGTGTSPRKRWSSSRAYYHKVSLCPLCSALRDRAARTQLIVALAIGGSLMSFCVCGGLLTSLMPKHSTTRTAVNQAASPLSRVEHEKGNAGGAVGAPSPPGAMPPSYHLSATVSRIDLYTQEIGLQHDGIVGRLPPGDDRFRFEGSPRSAGLSVWSNPPWSNALVGQKVECVMVQKNGKWVVRLISIKRSKPHSPETHTTGAQQALELSGTVTFVDPIKHQIGIRHDAIPGKLSAGDHCFAVALDVPVPMPGAPVGKEVDFVIESRNNQWLITKINGRGK